MAKKENKGGMLTNEQIEKELARTNAQQPAGQVYRGSQDTGDHTVRQLGTEVQQQDGTGDDDAQNA